MKLKQVHRKLTDDERARHEQIRAAALKDIPPNPDTHPQPAPPGITSKVRQAREARSLTWHALAEAAGVSSSSTIRAIEQGHDVALSDLQSVAAALGLRLDLVDQTA